MKRRTWMIGSMVTAGTLAAVAYAAPAPTMETAPAHAPVVEKAAPGAATAMQDAPARSLRVLPGVTRPGREVTISAPFDGVLMQLNVAEGSVVQAGEALASLDDRVARAAVVAARAEASADARITHATLELELTERLLARTRASHAAKGASAMEVDDATLRRDQAAASLASARFAQSVDEANLKLEEARLDAHVIRAPFTGVVTRVATDVGATLTGSAEILHLVALQTLRADQYLPAELYGAMETGRAYTLEAGAPASSTVTATLRFVEPVIDAATGTFRCVFEVPNSQRTMPAGVTVRLVPAELVRLLERSVGGADGRIRAVQAAAPTEG